jgi:hypothetical protein
VVLLVAVLLVSTVAVAASRVRRLDRLHRRLDAARAALAEALDRRAVAATRAGVAVAGTDDRETAANALTRALSGLDRSLLPGPLRAELADAEQLLVLARRVHNDAVRDTLGLRSLRMVRWFHLAGTAPMPEFFEIADPDDLGAMRKTTLGAPGPA